MKDHEIIDLYWQRDESAITATAAKYGSYCHSIAYNILCNEEDAEECVNDTYLGAWRSMPPQRPGKLAAFLGRITRNLSLNRLKQYTAQKRGGGQVELALAELEDCIPSTVTVEQITDARLLTEAINTFLRSQPAHKRHIFIRRYWYLDSIETISKTFTLKQSMVTSLLFRMRRELKIHLEKEGIQL